MLLKKGWISQSVWNMDLPASHSTEITIKQIMRVLSPFQLLLLLLLKPGEKGGSIIQRIQFEYK